MRKEAEIRKKMRQVKHRYLVREYKDKLARKSTNCIYYYEHGETDPETGRAVTVGLCLYGAQNPEEWPGDLCGGAKGCPYFETEETKEEIKQRFEESLENEVTVAQHYKDIAALQWVLGEKVYSWDLVWYQRLYLWFIFMLYKVSSFIRRSGLE